MIHEDAMSPLAATIASDRYAHDTPNGKETWNETAWRVPSNVLAARGVRSLHGTHAEMVNETYQAVRSRKFMPGGRYLASAGREYHQTQNCLLLRAEDSREGWGSLYKHVTVAIMTGAGIGVEYSQLREKGALLRRAGGVAGGPVACANGTNEIVRYARMGGHRRGALWAGLSWSHPDIFEFIESKNWPQWTRDKKAADFNFPAPLDHTNISVGLDDDFFAAMANNQDLRHDLAKSVYWQTINRMVRDGEPGFSVNVGSKRRENLRNACTEVTSCDDSDICNLGSLNMARIATLAEFRDLVRTGTIFLLAGTMYSDTPYDKVRSVRDMNRRLGLGLLGVHEWLLQRGYRYEPNDELAKWLEAYVEVSDQTAAEYADAWGIPRPLGIRAIAPTGTIGIVAETTTGAEPMFCAAYKRRYYDNGTWKAQYVIDPTAKRMVEAGIDPYKIESAIDLAADVERRLAFQAWLQGYVDHAISSTINLPPWGSELNNEGRVQEFGETMLRYLPKLRGVTVYPDGSRGGQPIVPVDYHEAASRVGEIVIEQMDVCDWRGGGSCGA